MARVSTTPTKALAAVVAQIIANSSFTADTCVYLLNPNTAPPPPNPGETFCCISPTSGNFDEGLFIGGGAGQVTVFWGITAKIYALLQTDEVGRSKNFLTDSTDGILAGLQKVMKALVGQDLTDSGGNQFLRELIMPADFVFDHSDPRLGSVEASFKLSFDWDLS